MRTTSSSLESEAERGLHLFLLHDEDLLDLALRQRRGLGPRARRDEPGHARRVANDVPRVVVVDHLHQQVAREDLLLDDLLLAALDLHHILHGDVHAEDLALHLHGVDAVLEVRLDLVLVARVRVDHVPIAGASEGTRPPCGHFAWVTRGPERFAWVRVRGRRPVCADHQPLTTSPFGLDHSPRDSSSTGAASTGSPGPRRRGPLLLLRDRRSKPFERGSGLCSGRPASVSARGPPRWPGRRVSAMASTAMFPVAA